uniref:GDSL esterase/lipase n=1 Tax=Oryza barthii TaxID=65489 RepID=A0A0D3FKR2_9ORYZ
MGSCTLSSGGVCVVVVLLSLACCLTCARGAVPAIYVLGDSQADVGNNNYLLHSLLKANFPHNGIDYPGGKPTGRFSNGYNFVDLIAISLGVPSPPPYLSISSKPMNSSVYLKGVNFASGGAGVSNLTNLAQCISFDEQIEGDYHRVHEALRKQLGIPGAKAHLAKSLFVVAIGGNDIINDLLLSPVSELLRSRDEIVSNLENTLKRQMQTLYDLGMRRLFFVGIAPLGCCPLIRELNPTKECDAQANYMATRLNDAAVVLLRDMSETHPDFTYSFFDTSTAVLQSIRYKEVKAACCGLGDNNAMFLCSPASVYCDNRTSYMFWDVVHPTQATVEKLMKIAFDGSAPLVSPKNIKQLTES